MLKTYKYRIYPTEEQAKSIDKNIDCCRFIYNWGLERKIEEYKKGNKLSYFDLNKELTLLKRKDGFDWLNSAAAMSLQQSLINLDNAFNLFFKETYKFPKFKSKKIGRLSCQFPQYIEIDFCKQKIKILKLGLVKIVFDRVFKGSIKTCTITKTRTNKYFISILVENPKIEPLKFKVTKNKTLGLDLGIKTFVTTSNGLKVNKPEINNQKLAVLQRRLSKKIKDSKNYNKLKLRISLLYERIHNQKQDFMHKLSTNLTHDNQVNTLIVEDLNISGMMKNHSIARAIQECSWYTFVEQLKYKCGWYGKNLIKIGRFDPSSKMCSNCNTVNKNLILKDREWQCSRCSIIHDRDINAAINIKNFGLAKVKLGGKELSPNQNKASLSDQGSKLGTSEGKKEVVHKVHLGISY